MGIRHGLSISGPIPGVLVAQLPGPLVGVFIPKNQGGIPGATAGRTYGVIVTRAILFRILTGHEAIETSDIEILDVGLGVNIGVPRFVIPVIKFNAIFLFPVLT